MRNLFSQVLNMSMTGSIVILLVMLARLMLKRSPKIFSYALWLVVLFRLLCPVAFTAPVSVLNALEPEIRETSGAASVVYFLPAEANRNPDFTFVPAENQSGPELAQAGKSEHAGLDIMAIVPYVWIAGTGSMILYSIVQYIRLRRKLVGAVAYTGNVYRADYIDTPFVMGILAPKIYLPSNIPTQEQKYIIAHERHHIRRCDHIIKLLAYCALCIHWFNPLAWAAFILAGKDMEMSCDEAVIREMGPQIRADYSASLLRLATHKKMIAGMPLAFGEGNTKGRIMNIAKWKKPKLWVSMICVLLCAAVLVACAVNPQKSDTIDDTPADGATAPTEERTPAADGSAVITDTKLVQYGTLKLLLPSGFSFREQDGNVVLTRDSVDVGGITSWDYPEFQLSDIIALKEEESGAPIGYTSGSSIYGDVECEIFWDGNPDALCEQHTFFIDGDIIYDIWYDENQISGGIAERFLKTVAINADTVVEENPDEQAAFAKCRAVLEAVQNGSCHIVVDQSKGDQSHWSTANYYQDNGNWLEIVDVDPESVNIVDGEQYSLRMAFMAANGVRYSNEGKWGKAYTNIEWKADEMTFGDSVKPWLAYFQWNDSVVAYMDTLEDESGITVMLRIDQPFAEGENEQPHYFVNFNFDTDGAFSNVYVQTNLFMNYSTSRTESVVSLDSELIEAEIQKEYQKAIG